MKFASFEAPDGSPTWGAVVDGQVHDLGGTGSGLAASLKQALERGLLDAVDLDGAPVRDEVGVTFLPALPDPTKIICVGVNYRSHLEETGREEAGAPTLFTRFADTQTAHLAPVAIPSVAQQFDYEGELAVVIGAHAHKVSREGAFSVVAGYSIYNDFTVRDWQRATTQWTPGKNFPATGAMGPYFVPAGDVDDLGSRTLETRVNGEQRQKASISDMRFDIPRLIEHITAFTPLAVGDIIVTGTPGGVGLFMDPPALLNVGDVVEVEITGLGVLRNEVVEDRS